MSGRYAQHTTVPVDRSKAEIERNLERFGASHFAYVRGPGEAQIGFVYRGVHIRFRLPLPDIEHFRMTPRGVRRADGAARQAMDKETRRRWRSLAAYVKAQLVGVEDGIVPFEEAFLPWMTLGSGKTIAEAAVPRIQAAIAEGRQLPNGVAGLLPAPDDG